MTSQSRRNAGVYGCSATTPYTCLYLKRVLGLMFCSLRRVLFIMILRRFRSLATMQSLPSPFLPNSFLGRMRGRQRPGPAENQASVYIRQSISDNFWKSSSFVLTDPKLWSFMHIELHKKVNTRKYVPFSLSSRYCCSG